MRKEKTKKKITGLDDERSRNTANLKKSLNIEKHETIGGLDLPEGRELKEEVIENSKNNYAATMVSAARRQNRRRADKLSAVAAGGRRPTKVGGAPINKRRRRRPQIVGGGAAGANFKTSDHQVVRWGLVGLMEQTQEVKAYVKRPNFFKADYDLVINRLKEKNLESAVKDMEVNDAWKKFNGIMREIIEKNIPKYKRTNKRRPWVTREVQKKRKAKNNAWKKFHKLKEEIRDGLSCENEARLKNLNRNYVNKRSPQ